MNTREEKIDAETSIVWLTGKLNATTLTSVQDLLFQLIDGGVRKLVLDLENLEYVSSAGLRVLLLTAKKLQGVGGKLLLCAVKGNVRSVLDISGFSSVFPLCDTKEAALAEAAR